MAYAKFVIKGDVDRVGRVLNQVKGNYNIIGNQIVDSNAEIFYEALIKNIEEQGIEWKPLNPEYQAKKGLLGLDTRILIATGEYLSNIQIRSIYKTGKVTRHVGVDSRTIHTSSGLKMSDLAIIHEYGTSDGRVPARPHYSTTWDEVREKIRDNTLAIARTMIR